MVNVKWVNVTTLELNIITILLLLLTPPLDIKGAKYFNYYQWTELTVHCCHKT